MELDRPSVIVALLTPFQEDGGLDEAALGVHVDYLVEAGVDALMPCGTTGEGALLSDVEVAEVVRATCAAAGGRVPVLAHVGRPGTAPTLALARQAVEHGAHAVSAVVPYYYPAGGDQIRAHYAALVEGLDGTPVYGYTIPERTHNELEPALLGALIADGLAGMKDSTKSIERHREYAAAVRDAGGRFGLFMGTASLVLEAVGAGAAGAVLAVANSHPELCADLVRACREGRQEDAERLQAELAAVEREIQRDGAIPGLKRRVAELLRERGAASYRTELRAPMGTAGRRTALRPGA
ncbi:MAG: dihydrodipicolinate synthase family protein [Thermoleophilaceae bacterium]